ncbi:MAG: thioredoxin family protein [Phaeodactylibacter sp.]|nr:thioredoxin family protein [Phaeodactylibacter sp.]MCB9273493.1 thioredoxin family protein [Lewinellaceae bacterium]
MVRIQVLGLGNRQHRQLSNNLMAALASIGLRADVEQVTDVDDILQLKVRSIPAIIYNGRIFFENGYTPTVEELREMLSAQAVEH